MFLVCRVSNGKEFETAYYLFFSGIKEFDVVETVKIPLDKQARPLYPGYIFLRLKEEPSYNFKVKLREIPWFFGVIFPKGRRKKLLLMEEVLESLGLNLESNYEILERQLVPNQLYSITAGPFKGFKCIFRKMVGDEAICDILAFRTFIPTKLKPEYLGGDEIP